MNNEDHRDERAEYPDRWRVLGGGLRNSAVLGRRSALKLLAGAGAVALIGCSDDDTAGDSTTAGSGTSGDAASSTASATSDAAPGSTSGGKACAEIPEETAGPFPGDGSNGPNVLAENGVVRSDIRSSFGSSAGTATGVPLTMTLSVVDTAGGCAPMPGAAVYVWHCDAEGRYSMYSEGATEENYLRGVQEADVSGALTFTSIFPGAYSGRWPHVHFEVFESVDAATSGARPVVTSQLAFPEDVCNEVYATDGYPQSDENMTQTTLQSDGVFGDDGAADQMANVTGNPDEGYTARLTVGV